MWTVVSQINIARIESRVAAGGHNVDSGKVIERIIRKHKEELSIYPNEAEELFVA